MADNGPLLELSKVGKRFGAVQALTEVDFAARAHQVTALVGDNGAGKSTLVKIISGIVPADSGTYGSTAGWSGSTAPRRPAPSGSRPSTRTSP